MAKLWKYKPKLSESITVEKNYFIVLVPFAILQQVLKERNHIVTDDLDQLRTDDLAQNMFLIFVMDLNYESKSLINNLLVKFVDL